MNADFMEKQELQPSESETLSQQQQAVTERTVGDSEKMVQVFMVVRCYSCKTFQVQQVKKTNKWVCKMCNEKQSVIKTYGKGTARACRMHVQKLNMARGTRERSEGGTSHPPCDYANTFTAQEDDKKDPRDNLMNHPVVLADAKRSKWTTFIEPPKDEDEEDVDGVYTTDRNGFTEASKARRKARRSSSDRRPHPLVSQEELCPYSTINLEMEPLGDHTAALTSSKSMYFHPDRYTKLDMPTPPPDKQQQQQQQQSSGYSHSMLDLSSTSSSPGNHKEWMSLIKQDLEQFSKDDKSRASDTISKPLITEDRKSIPQVSSRWSQFMCESDESESDEESHLLCPTNGELNFSKE